MATKTKNSAKAKPADKVKVAAPAAKAKKTTTAQPAKKSAPVSKAAAKVAKKTPPGQAAAATKKQKSKVSVKPKTATPAKQAVATKKIAKSVAKPVKAALAPAKSKASAKPKAGTVQAKSSAKKITKPTPKAPAKTAATKATAKAKVAQKLESLPSAKAAAPAKKAVKLKKIAKAAAAPELPTVAPIKSSSKGSPKAAQREPTVTMTDPITNVKTVATKKVAAKKPVKTTKKTGVRRIDAQPADFTPYARKKNEDYMNEEQRGHFKEILLAWKLQLMEEVDRTVNHMKDVAANDPDPADRATQEEEFSLELRTRDRERKLIRKIDVTIDLIDQDDYGYCDSCGIEIGIQRLEARPTATQCIDCKTLDEIKERQLHG
jgi:DnaK suppressor protein